MEEMDKVMKSFLSSSKKGIKKNEKLIERKVKALETIANELKLANDLKRIELEFTLEGLEQGFGDEFDKYRKKQSQEKVK